MRDALVRCQELNGRWVSLGSESARGITVEELVCGIDDWGPREASFTLRRKTTVPWPDIGAFAPVEVESQGVPVWSGRVKGTPTTDGSDRKISVNCEGLQYHLDDDVYQKTYAHARLTDWVDQRSYLESNLAAFIANGQVAADGSGITFAYPAGTYPAGACVGITLDFGPSLCKRIGAINWTSSNNATIALIAAGSDTPDATGTTETAWSVLNNTAATGSQAFTFTNAHRYVHFFMFWSAGGTLISDVWIKMNLARLFSSTAYESGSSSILKASDVLLDAKAQATLLLSSDTSKVQVPTFTIADFAMSQLSTPREAINGANAFQNWQPRVGADRLLEYRPLPSKPIVQLDARSMFDEASSGDASQIYSNVAVTYADPGGVPQIVQRSQPPLLFTSSSIVLTNPGYEVDLSNWSGLFTGGPITTSRDTVQHDTGVASAKFAFAAAGQQAFFTTAFGGGSLVPGRTYRLGFSVRTDTALTGGLVYVQDSNGKIVGTVALGVPTLNTWTPYTIDFQPSTTALGVVGLASLALAGAGNVWIDSFLIYEASATVVDRRGFRRTKVFDTSMALSTAGAQQIADVFLAAHRSIPLKGSAVVTGYGTAKRIPSGASMTPAELLLCGGELVRFMHLVDPDTGALGREGRIASVSWDASSDTSTIEIDSESQNFEAMLSRLALLTSLVA